MGGWGEEGRSGVTLSVVLRGQLRGQVWGPAGLLGQQLVEGLGGPPVLVLTAGAVLLHDPVVLEAEPASFDAGGKRGVDRGSLLPSPPGYLAHPPEPGLTGRWQGPIPSLAPSGQPLGLPVPVCTMGPEPSLPLLQGDLGLCASGPVRKEQVAAVPPWTGEGGREGPGGRAEG